MLRATAVLALVTLSSAAVAKPAGGFTADVSNGVAIQLGDNDYRNFADPSYQFGLRAGWDFHLTKLLGIGPEVGLDAAAVTVDSSTFGNVPSRFARVKGLFGARFTVHFSIGYFFVRAMFGVDHTEGSFGNSLLRVNLSSTGFAFVPETGVLFKVWRMLHAGFTLGFPVGTNDFGAAYVGTVKSFNGIDITLQGTVGVHL